jgi:hypothetical protein
MQLKNKNDMPDFKNINKYSKPFLVGILGMLGLVVIYVSVMLIATKNLNSVISQFITFKYWITALILGFGIQTSLFWYIRSGMHLPNKSSKTALATGAGTSTVAMVACCAHHLTDFLPILGLSAAALFLSKYQTHFFAFGIISNIAGIALMIYIIKTKKCFNIFKFLKNKFNSLDRN